MPLFNTFVNAIATLTNTKFGKDALSSASLSGTDNVAIGKGALAVNTTAASNTAVGASALTSNLTGSFNTAVGKGTASGITTGTNNTAIGYLALSSASGVSKSNNTVVGYQAGVSISGGDGNTLIGSGANVSVAARDNCIAIGRDASAGDNANGEIAIGAAARPVVTGVTAMVVGAAAALPGLPAGWLQVKINGTYQKFPYWNN